ncbi:MAG TPA: outer membrane beta-barrel protein, partial [Pseudolabrys sp.]|nr:outer membrane beta-barrel protein [Pseudolabrys sp.]
VMVRSRIWLLGAALGVLMAGAPQQQAAAADWPGVPVLRGGMFDGYARWEGVYAGGHVGASSMTSNFGNAVTDQVAFILRNSRLEDEFAPSSWTTLPTSSTNSMQYGAFIGYNWQWDDVVLGLEVGYSRLSSMQDSAADSIARRVTTSDSIQHDVTIAAQSSIKLIDYAALRGRAGYAFGQFLPYAVLGLAVGRFNYSNAVTLADAQTDVSTTPGTFLGTFTGSASDAKDNAFAGGFVAGLGMDVLLMPNVFLRGEWEYVAFGTIGGVRTSINVARAGLGLRF